MSLNSTPAAERVHIGIFGRRNAGKSSLINALTNQKIAIVSATRGTTTDPVFKAMELLPLGPVMLIDTPGIDDTGALGSLRVEKAYQILHKTDICILVIDALCGMTPEDASLAKQIQEQKLPLLAAVNKSELLQPEQRAVLAAQLQNALAAPCLFVSAVTGENITALKETLADMQPAKNSRGLLDGLVAAGALLVLVTPIDSAAPKGRLILPQQQVLRTILDHNALALVVQEDELPLALSKLKEPPQLVITDSQAFGKVARILPATIPLTSFSILFARYKGSLATAVSGVRALDKLHAGAKILISEGCTHHRQCGDIGTVKLPAWIRAYSKTEPQFCFSSGTEFPRDLSEYALVIHCGGCMLNEKEMLYRYSCAVSQNIPMTNYGIAIAQMHGILRRAVAPLPEIAALLD